MILLWILIYLLTGVVIVFVDSKIPSYYTNITYNEEAIWVIFWPVYLVFVFVLLLLLFMNTLLGKKP